MSVVVDTTLDTCWPSFAMCRKFLAKGVIAVKILSTAFLPFDQEFKFAIEFFRSFNVFSISACKEGRDSVQEEFLRSGIAKFSQFGRRSLSACSSWITASLYRCFVR